MRLSIALALIALGAAAAVKTSNPKNGRALTPTAGIKTPGVKIPFSKLKPEAEIPAGIRPPWIFFSTSVYIPTTTGVHRIDVKTNKQAGVVGGLAKPCGGMASAFGSVWIPDCGDGTLVRHDAKDHKLSGKLAVGAVGVPGAITSTADSIWALVDEKTTLARVDPDANTVVAEIRLPAGCRSLLEAEKSLWIACPSQDKVLRINPATNLVEQRVEVSGEPVALAAGDGSIWALCRKQGKIDRIDPKTNKVTKAIETGVPGVDGSMAFGDGSLWISMPGFPLTRLDPKSEAVVQQFYGEGGGAIETSKGALWLATDNGVWRIDPKLVVLTLAE